MLYEREFPKTYYRCTANYEMIVKMIGSNSITVVKTEQVIQVQKLVGLLPPHSNYLGVFFRFRRTFAEVITFGETSGHEC